MGFGSHTFLWVNAQRERFWVKFHFKTDQSIRCLTTEEAEAIGGREPHHTHKDLYDAIGRRPRSIRRTSFPGSARRPTACCRRACSPTATPIATGSASTTRACP